MSEQEKISIEETTAAPMGEPDPEKELPDKPENDIINNNPDVLAYIEKAVKDGIQEGIKKALKGQTPKADITNQELADFQRKAFNKMNYKERLNLFISDPQYYNKLTQMQKENK